jgi:hypothetical protein
MHKETAMAKLDREYVSEFGQFITRYLDQHPEVVADQKVGWRIFWDKKIDFDFQQRAEQGRVPTDSYYYFGNPSPGGHDSPTITDPAATKDNLKPR